MTKKIKYIARFDGQIVGTRTSGITNKTYTHAIVIWGHGKSGEVIAWASRLDLAQGQARSYVRYGFRAEIVPAEIVPPKVKAA